ncbi:CocE/NonD family hydrolase [Paenibacillus sp. GCM10012306]|uniref:CocE/NonD family hydrolase n=1 Tax=Paenibacillus sp. GCM10012306 TaxID=3317342 RepID=UPI0036167D3C
MSEKQDSEFPAPQHEVGERQDLWVTMSDGVQLMTHIWLSRGEQPAPVIVVRNPYIGREFRPDPEVVLLSAYGYNVIIQECRGRGSSGGRWVPFIHEKQDGLDTLDWIISQHWCNGNIGLYGGSYLGFNHWVLADSLPPEVKTLYISVIGTEQQRFIYMDGMFRPDIYTSWAVTNAGADLGGRSPRDLEEQARQFRPPLEMDVTLLGKQLDWYHDFLLNPGAGDELWQEGFWQEFRHIPSRLSVPVCMVGGWFDIALESMMLTYEQIPPEIRERSRFIVGPWVHSLAPHGDRDFPGGTVNGGNGGFREVLGWFDYMLKQTAYEEELGTVKTYVIGADGWQNWTSWPPPVQKRTYYLGQHNVLNDVPEVDGHQLTYTYDPLDPVITVGGSGLLSTFEAGPDQPRTACALQLEPGYRQDVLSFLSAPLEEELFLAGSIETVLQVKSTAEDTSFTVKVSEVLPDGRTYNIADGITSLAYRNGSPTALPYSPGSLEEITLQLWPITWVLGTGSRIRVDISSSNFPAYHVHPNRAGNWSKIQETVTAEQSIYWGGGHNASIQLPVWKPQS